MVERIACRGCAKDFAVTAAKPLDRLLIEQAFGCRKQGEAGYSLDRSLIGGIERSNALDFVAKEIEAHCVIHPAWEKVHEAPAYGEVARIGNCFATDIPIGLQQFGQIVTIDALTGREPGNQLAQAERCQRALRGGVDGRD